MAELDGCFNRLSLSRPLAGERGRVGQQWLRFSGCGRCGTGLTGILLAQVASHVYLTDLGEEVLQNCQASPPTPLSGTVLDYVQSFCLSACKEACLACGSKRMKHSSFPADS